MMEHLLPDKRKVVGRGVIILWHYSAQQRTAESNHDTLILPQDSPLAHHFRVVKPGVSIPHSYHFSYFIIFSF